MTLIDTFQLHQTIPQEEFDYTLLTSVLSPYSGVRQKISALLKAKVITRVKKGLYIFGPKHNRVPVCKESLANLIYGPSCISLEYALAFHGLIPERVETITSITPKKDKKFDTPIGTFTYRYLTLEKYTVGVEQVWIDHTHPVLMASAEKALCDYIVLNKIPLLVSDQDVSDFLEGDLRIDRTHWKQFNLKSFRELSKVFKNKNIDRALDVLEHKGSD